MPAGRSRWSGPRSPRLVEVRWLLEEYRVSLFAQRLGTAQPVSPQRIVKALAGKLTAATPTRHPAP